jgi:hypothetical protein
MGEAILYCHIGNIFLVLPHYFQHWTADKTLQCLNEHLGIEITSLVAIQLHGAREVSCGLDNSYY